MIELRGIGGRAVALIAVYMIFIFANKAFAQTEPDDKDVVFATIGEKRLALDIYLPEGVEKPPYVFQIGRAHV